MTDTARFDVEMNAVDNGVERAVDAASDSLNEYNQTLVKLARQEAANQRLEEVKNDFAALTDEQKAAIVAADDERIALEQLTQAERETEEQTDLVTAAHQQMQGILTEVNSGLQIVSQAAKYAQQAYDATVATAVDYIQTIHDLSTVSGQNMETTSRMVQVLDDFKIGTEAIEAAMRKMTANGMTPSLQTIAKLSDQYNTITDVQERNKFMVDNLGRSGKDWNLVLSQGSAALLANASAVDGNLIVNQKMYQQTEQLRMAQDQLADTQQALFLQIGTQGIPITNNWLTILNRTLSGQSDQRTAWMMGMGPLGAIIHLTNEYAQANNENEAKLQATTEAEKRKAEATQIAAQTDQEAAEAAQALSQAYTSVLQATQSLQAAVDTHDQSIQTLRDQQKQLEDQLVNTPTWDTNKINDYKAKLDEIPGKMAEVEAKYAESVAKMAYDNYIAKVSVDGLTTAEFIQAQQVGVSLGLFTQATADRAVAMDQLTTKLAEGQITIDEFNKAVQDGSLKVDESNKAIITGYDEVSRTVKTKNDEAATSAGDFAKTVQEKGDANKKQIDDYNKKVTDSADLTKTKTQSSIDSWNVWSDGVQENVDYAILAIQDYINKIGEIPAIPQPPATDEGGGSGESFRAGGSGSQAAPGGVISHRVDIYVNGNYQESLTLI